MKDRQSLSNSVGGGGDRDKRKRFSNKAALNKRRNRGRRHTKDKPSFSLLRVVVEGLHETYTHEDRVTAVLMNSNLLRAE